MPHTFSLLWLPGAWKTTLGKPLANDFGIRFLDFDDDIIEKTQNDTVANILKKIWEDEFKLLEEELALDIKSRTSTVLASSGSLPYSDKAMQHLWNLWPRIYLNPPIEEILARCEKMKTDRIIGMWKKSLETILKERADLYSKYADITFEYSGDDIDKISQDLIQTLWQEFFWNFKKNR